MRAGWTYAAFAPLLVTSPAVAEGLYVPWCSANEIMYIEENSIGFNEHTVCDLDIVPVVIAGGKPFRSKIACRNVHYVDGDGGETAVETPIPDLTHITLTGAADGTLILNTKPNGSEESFLPCGFE